MKMLRPNIFSLGIIATLSFSFSALAVSYDEYSITDTSGQACSQCSLSSAGDIDGDAQGDFLVRDSVSEPSYYIMTATALAGSKSIDLIKAEYHLNSQTCPDLSGRTLDPTGDVDGDGKDDFFMAEGDTYEKDKNDERLILATDLSDYKNTVEESNTVLTSKAPAETVSVGVGVSKDINCALDPSATHHSGWFMILLSIVMALTPITLVRRLRRPVSVRIRPHRFK